MPLYDFKCNDCGLEAEMFCKLEDLHAAMCNECGGTLRVLITHYQNKDWFRPHWNENFDTYPVYVESKSHMKQLCKKHDVTSRALGDVRNLEWI